uniref:Putative lipocalin-3 1 n=1 Tax=Amblyomma cajennense TaxID=34607 RepID=A0A023FFN2_AMBCJ
MALKQSIQTIAFVLLATVIHSNAEELRSSQGSEPDIEKFYSNGSVIWSYSISTDGQHLCKVDFAVVSNQPDISFKRYSSDLHTRIPPARFRGQTFRIRGRFTNTRAHPPSGKFDTMDIEYYEDRQRQGHTGTSGMRYLEAIVFESENGDCAVFAVRPSPNTEAVRAHGHRRGPARAQVKQTLDLRIKSSSEDAEKTKRCFQEFKSEKYTKLHNGRVAQNIMSLGKCKTGCLSNQECAQRLLEEQ